MPKNTIHIRKNTISTQQAKKVFISISVILALIIFIDLGIQHLNQLRQEQEEEQARIEQELKEEEERKAQEEAQRQEQERQQYLAMLPQLQFDAIYNLKSLGLASYKLNVPILYQHPELPAGCECVSLTNQLNYYGFNLNKSYLIENYLKYSKSDFVYYYYGSPYDYKNGGVIMAPGTKNLANAYLSDNNANFIAFDITGKNFEDLYAYIERGHPVQIWCSLSMSSLGGVLATSGQYYFYENSHSAVIEGFDKTLHKIYMSDPIYGHAEYSESVVKNIYNLQNKQAIVIVTQEELNKWINGEEAKFKVT